MIDRYLDIVTRPARGFGYRRECHLSRDDAIALATLHRMRDMYASVHKMRTRPGYWQVKLNLTSDEVYAANRQADARWEARQRDLGRDATIAFAGMGC